MLFLLAMLTASYLGGVCWLRRSRRRRTPRVDELDLVMLPAEDQPPLSAVGWPPAGARFTRYVDEGVAALDAYLSEGYAA